MSGDRVDGLFGKLLDVNMTTGRMGKYSIPENWQRLYLGGKGLAARILLKEYRKSHPLAPSNILIYMTGPLVGQSLGGSGRHVVVTHSPLTNFFGEAYCGGFFGTELRRTGYDGLMFRGAASEPMYLTILEGSAELRSARELWGKTSGETEDWLRAKHGRDVKVSCIGPAGENQVRFAAIMNDRNRANARCGVGAVMGSKNLKAVAVKGNLNPSVHDPKAFDMARREYTKTLITEDMKSFGKYGTSGGIEALSHMGILPTKNFQAGSFAGASRISGETMHDTIMVDRDTCASCPVRCKRVVRTEADGQKVTPDYGGPEYETIASFGSLQMNDKLEWIALANQLCNAYGLDTISTGNVIAYAMEASEQGLIDDVIEWGDCKRACELIDKIAHRKGIGDILAGGVAAVSEWAGGKDFAMHVKGLEVAMHEPRGKKGLGLSYAVSPRGASHMEGFHDTQIGKVAAPDIGVDKPMNRFVMDGKAEVLKKFEDARSFVNSLLLCVFDVDESADSANLPIVRDMTSAVTGLRMDRGEMMRVGERAYNLARMFSVRMGLSRKDDDLPQRFKESPLPFKDRSEAIPQDELDRAIRAYYNARGWDENGRPTAKRLRSLGVDISS